MRRFAQIRTKVCAVGCHSESASIFTDASGNPLPGLRGHERWTLSNGGLPNISITGLGGLGAGTNHARQGNAPKQHIEAYANLSLIVTRLSVHT